MNKKQRGYERVAPTQIIAFQYFSMVSALVFLECPASLSHSLLHSPLIVNETSSSGSTFSLVK